MLHNIEKTFQGETSGISDKHKHALCILIVHVSTKRKNYVIKMIAFHYSLSEILPYHSLKIQLMHRKCQKWMWEAYDLA